MKRLGALVALSLALGCGDPPARRVEPSPLHEPAAEPVSALAPETSREPLVEQDCELSPTRTWIEGVGPRGSLALGAGSAGALVVALADGAFWAQGLSETGSPRGPLQAGRWPSARALLALQERGPRWLLVGRGSCPEAAQCVSALGLDAEGRTLGAPVAAALPGEPRTTRRAASPGDGPLFVAWSTDDGQRALERFELGASGEVGRMRLPLGTEPPHPDSPVEILGLAAEGGRWACVWRRGPTEDVRSRVHLTTADHHREVEALHEALAIDAAHLEGDTVSVVATFEFSRPHFVRLRADREEPLVARELGPSEGPPPPLAGRERAELDVDERGLWLLRRDAAGYPLGAPTQVVAGPVESAALVRVGDARWVAWWSEGAVRGRAVRCRR